MAKIDQSEYEVLKDYFFQGYRWIAIRRGGLLVVSKVKPDKLNGLWLPQCPDEDWFTSINATDLFQFIKWTDKEPYSINDLVAEYEAEAFKNHVEESEETEVKKDKKWATKEIESLETESSQNYPHDEMIEKEIVLSILDQLEEPEVLSQELPVIPKFVADYIEECKRFDESGRKSLYTAMDSMPKEASEWMTFNVEGFGKGQELFARAWLDGYEVENDQKYIISINITDKASKTKYETFLNKRGIFHSMKNESFNSEEFNWTEEEIKDLENGEILFEHFAVKVEELEE